MTTRLLIIDDDPEITSALARGLALHGYDAVTENRADQGLARLEAEPFSGAIVDVMLGAESNALCALGCGASGRWSRRRCR